MASLLVIIVSGFNAVPKNLPDYICISMTRTTRANPNFHLHTHPLAPRVSFVLDADTVNVFLCLNFCPKKPTHAISAKTLHMTMKNSAL